MKDKILEITGQQVLDTVILSVYDVGFVLRAWRNAHESFYLKEVLPNMSAKVNVAHALGESMGEYYSSPLAADVKRGLSLMKGYEKPLLNEDCSINSNPETFWNLLIEWACAQEQSVAVLDHLA